MLERTSNFIFILLSTINLLGTIVSGVWLAILGEWKIIGIGIASVLSASFVITLAIVPGSLFKFIGTRIQEKGLTWTGFAVESIFSLYQSFLVFLTGIGSFYYFTNVSTEENAIPMLLWSHSVATGVWASLGFWAINSKKTILGVTTFLYAVILSIFYLFSIVLYTYYEYSFQSITLVLACSSLVGLIVQVAISGYAVHEDKKPWYERTPY